MKNKINHLNWRFFLIFASLLICLIGILLKIFSIQISDSGFLQDEGAKRYIKYRTSTPVRGSIFDRNNFPLAVSIVNYDLYALKGFNKSQLLKLSEIIEIDPDLINEGFERKTLLKKSISNKLFLRL